ncbi:MAG TPA: hypothetical protein VFX61_17330 [Micromonosporaceae bacterium]|nr:hypothetical protein [Micromonosporaceae bacterium]
MAHLLLPFYGAVVSASLIAAFNQKARVADQEKDRRFALYTGQPIVPHSLVRLLRAEIGSGDR